MDEHERDVAAPLGVDERSKRILELLEERAEHWLQCFEAAGGAPEFTDPDWLERSAEYRARLDSVGYRPFGDSPQAGELRALAGDTALAAIQTEGHVIALLRPWDALEWAETELRNAKDGTDAQERAAACANVVDLVEGLVLGALPQDVLDLRVEDGIRFEPVEGAPIYEWFDRVVALQPRTAFGCPALRPRPAALRALRARPRARAVRARRNRRAKAGSPARPDDDASHDGVVAKRGGCRRQSRLMGLAAEEAA
jgi:hypothetical protein